MKLAQSVRLGAWFLIALNLVMAFGSIWVFTRMAPVIEIIIERNERSLYACEEMLSGFALVDPDQSADDVDLFKSEFSEALRRAENNITEKEETIALEAIEKNYIKALEGNLRSKKKTVAAIQHLSQINRDIMVETNRKAKQLGHAGAWWIVFMASVVFMVGMLFMRGLKRSLVKPLEEIHSVIQAAKAGDKMRRCTDPGAPQDIRSIFDGFNDILDQNTLNTLNTK
jgi:methyl-accepting chemotaxis protein